MNWKYPIRLTGGLIGPIWWPSGRVCCALITLDLRHEASRSLDRNVTLRELLLSIQTERGGDFQHCQFTGDTELTISRTKRTERMTTTTQCTWKLTSFKSVSDLVAGDQYSSDYHDA